MEGAPIDRGRSRLAAREPMGLQMKTLASLLLASLLLVPATGCGTLLFKERQDQEHSERIDPNVAILDGIGLLFFVIPGLVAYGIDFYTEAIYLPHHVAKGEGPFISDSDTKASESPGH